MAEKIQIRFDPPYTRGQPVPTKVTILNAGVLTEDVIKEVLKCFGRSWESAMGVEPPAILTGRLRADDQERTAGWLIGLLTTNGYEIEFTG